MITKKEQKNLHYDLQILDMSSNHETLGMATIAICNH
jgi:hypothetical protein